MSNLFYVIHHTKAEKYHTYFCPQKLKNGGQLFPIVMLTMAWNIAIEIVTGKNNYTLNVKRLVTFLFHLYHQNFVFEVEVKAENIHQTKQKYSEIEYFMSLIHKIFNFSGEN